jgi:membrane-associated phospholipid phosphatase
VLRRINESVLDRASVQANTLPSGHVAGAVATALGVWPVSATAGAILLVVAAMIAVAAIAGRYHYVVDCVSGAVVPAIVAVGLTLS